MEVRSINNSTFHTFYVCFIKYIILLFWYKLKINKYLQIIFNYQFDKILINTIPNIYFYAIYGSANHATTSIFFWRCLPSYQIFVWKYMFYSGCCQGFSSFVFNHLIAYFFHFPARVAHFKYSTAMFLPNIILFSKRRP